MPDDDAARGGPAPESASPSPGPAPAPAFKLHRSRAPAGGGSSLGLDRRARALLAMGLVFAVFWGVYLLGRGGPAQPQVAAFPPGVALVELGMTTAELEAVGGHSSENSDGEVTRLRFYFPQNTPRSGESCEASVNFDESGALIYFATIPDDFVRGPQISPSDLASLAPLLGGAKMLRTPVDLAELEGELGPGRQVGRILDQQGEEVLLRWEVGEGRTYFQVRARAGKVMEHSTRER